MLSQRCSVLLTLDTATKITVDSKSPPHPGFAIGVYYKRLPYLAPFPSYRPSSTFPGERCSVSPNPVAMATKITTDSESPTRFPRQPCEIW